VNGGAPSATGGFRAAFIAVSSGISPPTSAGDTDLLRIPLEILEGVGGAKRLKRYGRVTVKAAIHPGKA